MKEIGQKLKDKREENGVSVEEAAEDLKMRPSQITNLEEGNTESFKDSLFLKYFIRDYAKYLGLDFEKILDEYKTINWDTQKLNLDYLQSILPKGETYVVDKIYEFITELVNSNFENKFIEQFNLILKQDYKKKEKSDFKIEGNGVEDIRKILINLIEGETNEI